MMDKESLIIYVFLMLLGIGLTPLIVQNTTTSALAADGISGFTASLLQVFPYLFLIGMVCLPVFMIAKGAK